MVLGPIRAGSISNKAPFMLEFSLSAGEELVLRHSSLIPVAIEESRRIQFQGRLQIGV